MSGDVQVGELESASESEDQGDVFLSVFGGDMRCVDVRGENMWWWARGNAAG